MKKVKSMSSAFSTLKGAFFVMAFLTVGTAAFSIVMTNKAFKEASERIYVVSQNGTVTAGADYNYSTSVFEVRNHIRSFFGSMFTFEAKNFDAQVEKALNLISRQDGIIIYNSFKEQNVYEDIVKTGARATIRIDNIEADMSREPFQCAAYCEQIFETSDNKSSQSFGAEFEVVKVARSETNPHGLLIQNVTFVEYTPSAPDENSEEETTDQ